MRAQEIKMLRDYGLTPAQIQRLTKCIKGVNITVGVGVTIQSLQLTGTAKYLLGVRTADAAATANTFTLKLNNETIFDTASQLLTDVFGAVRDEYVECFRKLNGQDTIQVEYNSGAGATSNFMLFYLT